jgi:hypothetical protein
MEQEPLRSTRFSSRARTEGGFALVSALTLALLYFMLMHLLLVDSTRELNEARRFRSRVVATIVSENAVELAAAGMVGGTAKIVNETDDQGEMSAELDIAGGSGSFEITGSGTTAGTEPQDARVVVQGRIVGTTVHIDYTMHGQ